MWLLTTKNRPQACEQTLAACWDTGMRQAGVVYVDGPNHAPYDGIKLPPNWRMVKFVDLGGIGNLAGSKQYVFTTYPNERVYGWLADDNTPVTQNWCEKVEAIAYPWRLVHCHDDFVSAMPTGMKQLQQSTNLGGAMCWGGDLLRCVGWWAPPGIIQGSIDWFWTSLVSHTKLAVYRDDIIVKHDNWRTGRRAQDANDDLKKPHILKDVAYIGAYIKTPEFAALKKRVLNEYTKYARDH